jgi:hypothetical protein
MERALEELVWERARDRCEYCRLSQENHELTFEIDHIRSESHGGLTTASNLCLAYYACNHHKGPNLSGVDPKSSKIVPLFNPRRHKWSRHFRWDGPFLVGQTPCGRATVVTLRINLNYRVDLRQGLIDEGVFSP